MSRRAGQDRPWFTGVVESIYQAFAEFLALSASPYLLDRAQPVWLVPLRNLLQKHVFADPAATSSLLSTIAGGLMTVASITISLLLLALQQSAANMTTQILDQFLRRRINQAYFGFFVGLALYSLVALATVDKPFNPIFGATLAFLLTVVALYLPIILLYTTINQMRPVQVMEAIHDHVLAARERQLVLARKTRRKPSGDGSVTVPVKVAEEGFVTRIDVDAIGLAALGRGNTGIGAIVDAAAAARAVGVVIVTTGPSGEAALLNAPEEPVSPLPVGILAPKKSFPFQHAASDRAKATLILDAEMTRRRSQNVIGRIERSNRWIAISTPRSGWFQCVGERGTGTSVFLGTRNMGGEAVSEAFYSPDEHRWARVLLHRFT